MKPFQRLQSRLASAVTLANRQRIAACAKQIRRNNTTATSILQDTEKTGNSFTQDLITYNHPTAPLASFNQRLARKLRSPGSPRRIRDNVLEIVQEIRQRNLKLDVNTYNALLAAHTRMGDAKAILATLNEMEAEGIQPSLDSYNTMLEALGSVGDIVHQNEILEMMKRSSVVPTVSTYAQLLRGFCQLDMLETALDVLDGMKKAGVAPNPTCYSLIIGSCLRLNECQMAFDLLKEAESSSMAVESEPSIYLDVMRATAFADEFEMATYCWKKAIHTFNLRPDEGTCLSMLRLAAKNADPKLATDVIRQLSTSGYPYKEPYFTPLLEAFVAKKDIKSAFNVLDIMRVSGVQPNVRSTLSIKRYLGDDLDRIDNAYYILEELRKDGKTVDVAAFNVVIDACAEANDLKRTVATYREAKNLGVTPDVETYNAVLGACIVEAVKGMGTVILDEMKQAGVAPNAETYSRMVALCCTQRNYEDAFQYLEEMKGYGIVPPASCYETLVKKLASENDPRFHIALEEMEGLGYKVTGRIRSLWNK